MIIGTLIDLWLNAKYVGCDANGNRYYLAKKDNAEGKKVRSVLYNKTKDSTSIPPLWHAWLHYLTDILGDAEVKYEWQKDRLPNATGSVNAYLPEGHFRKSGKRAKASGDYVAWNPAD